MKKKNFVSLVMGTIGGILFAIGLCMCLLPQWNAWTQGVVMAAIGTAVLVAMLLVRRKMVGKPMVVVSGKAIGTLAIGIAGALGLGVGMCMAMVWQGLMVPGIVVGILGILILLSLIPVCKGLKA